MKQIYKSFLLFIFLVLMGCSAANLVVDPYADLEITANHNINPDSNGRPSPVVVYVFELTSNTLFEIQDFFSIYEEHEKVLGPDLVNKYEISLTPGQKEIYQASMSPKTEYLGIVAAFRDIENSNWRQVIKVDKTGYNTYQISLEDLSLVVQ
ncbi:type VI secretion system lipoprotein TssJ [Vibrio parahaemolyticus]|uniref:type VI secretion system lipoprotein TssJ n=1 Tax=Vibrio parahaemolyticus TaxID=670 RepID=UPI000422D5FE|nr:type VI secretion system lipoprotein TssJ [Vibrio parahaemolyticus]EGR3412849.1 type VI secretion system lipoprotein TssJ [Vibrio parahaemolyticus]EHH2512641.1 type VI secretion system lipoprotein TssJ [Vibrio parahaemolyticus]EJE1251160.1 type VI secretion system lipoprotein TssJ [Vibrio parahaemolyticus]EJE4558240.1 type VI secretion system lipoprotein TssJ [Vibrio parahaemolyticus]EJG1766747.1 type VI secretion system lipoprotein TssJ [Vibrio parahaemolyticus]